MATKQVYSTTIAGFDIRLYQSDARRAQHRDCFAVLYGQQLTCDLTYEEAAKELGAAIMHAQACRGALQP